MEEKLDKEKEQAQAEITPIEEAKQELLVMVTKDFFAGVQEIQKDHELNNMGVEALTIDGALGLLNTLVHHYETELKTDSDKDMVKQRIANYLMADMNLFCKINNLPIAISRANRAKKSRIILPGKKRIIR